MASSDQGSGEAAANDALDDLRRRLPSPEPLDQVDLDALARQLAVLRVEAQREMHEIVTAIQDGMSQLSPGAAGAPGVSLPDTGALFDAMNRAMEPLLGAGAAAGPGGRGDHQGTGQAGDGLVRAVAVPPGRPRGAGPETGGAARCRTAADGGFRHLAAGPARRHPAR